MEYRLDSVWPGPTREVMDDVVQFWNSESALSAPAAQQRATQLLIVARTRLEQIAAVSTAVRTYVPQLGFECFYYRMFVGHQHRARGLHATGLLQSMVSRSFDVLDHRFQAGIDDDVIGLYVEVENLKLLRSWRPAVWKKMGASMTYIGRTPEGRDMRVSYFDGASLPPRG